MRGVPGKAESANANWLDRLAERTEVQRPQYRLGPLRYIHLLEEATCSLV